MRNMPKTTYLARVSVVSALVEEGMMEFITEWNGMNGMNGMNNILLN
jgi:hypothetical protein